MVAPYGEVYERDESGYINSDETVNVFLAASAPCGPVGTRQVLNAKNFYNRYTPNGQYKSGYPTAFLNAEAVFNTNTPVYFTRVIPEDALYGGAVVTIGNQKPSYSLTNGLATPDSFVFADVTTMATNESAAITCKADSNGNLGGTYFILPNEKDFVYLQNTARAEKASITCKADYQLSLNGSYFVLPYKKKETTDTTEHTQYYVWFNVDNSGTDPGSSITLFGKTGVEVKISANATAPTIATAIQTALASNSEVTCTIDEDNAAKVYFTVKTQGVAVAGNSGTTGFAYLTEELGVAASGDVALTDKTGYKAIIAAGAGASDVATAVNSALSSCPNFNSQVDAEDNTKVVITAVATGYMNDIQDGLNPTNFVFNTITQGSSANGSEALLFYSSDPNALDLSFTVLSHQDHPDIAPLEGTFVVNVYKNGVLVEEGITCSRDIDAKDGNGQPLYVETAMLASNYIRCRDNKAVDAREIPVSITTPLQIGGGSAGSDVTTGDMIRAVQEWRNRDDFDITLIMVGGWTDSAYVYELEDIAKSRGDCCVINSIPTYIENAADYLDSIVNYRKNQLNINSSYVATFSSSLEVYNSSLNRNLYIASDGHVAGAIINAAKNYQIYYPILGFKRGTLSNVLDVKRRFTREEMDSLYKVQINPIRFVPGQGIVIWGQKTMQTQASSLDRLNARLLLCSIKPTLRRFLEEYIGELNTDRARDAVKAKLDNVFERLKANEGILDYEVTCDPIDPNEPNMLRCQVRIQITPAVEYAELTITLTPVGIEF